MRRERFTLRYRGNPEGVAILAGRLRRAGLKVGGDLSLRLPYQGQAWSIRRDFVESYGMALEVSGRPGARSAARGVVIDFELQYPDAAEIEFEG